MQRRQPLHTRRLERRLLTEVTPIVVLVNAERKLSKLAGSGVQVYQVNESMGETLDKIHCRDREKVSVLYVIHVKHTHDTAYG